MAEFVEETLSSLPSSSMAPTSEASTAVGVPGKDYCCSAEEVADAKLTTRRETLLIIESLTQEFLQAIANGDDPELHLVNIKLICLYLYCFSLSMTHMHTHTHTHRPLALNETYFVIHMDTYI